jgi:hypothetical protein
MAAQEAKKSDKERARAYRERRREDALNGSNVTRRDAPVTKCDATVTPHHDPSRDVTPRHSPSLPPSAPLPSDLSLPARVPSTGIARRVWISYLDRVGAAGEKAIAELLPGLMAEFKNDEAKVEATLMHALAVARGEAARGGSTQWLDANMWQSHRFENLRVRQINGEPQPKRPHAVKPADDYRPPIKALGEPT